MTRRACNGPPARRVARRRRDLAGGIIDAIVGGAAAVLEGIFHRMITRLGKAAKMPFSVHPHMLRHACGFKLANDGQDTRALQHYLGHKNIQHTVRYTELSRERFRDFWKD